MNYSRFIKISVIFVARLIYGGLLNACCEEGGRKLIMFIYLFID